MYIQEFNVARITLQAGHLSEINDDLAVQYENCSWVWLYVLTSTICHHVRSTAHGVCIEDQNIVNRKLALIFPFLLHAIILSLRFTFAERKNG